MKRFCIIIFFFIVLILPKAAYADEGIFSFVSTNVSGDLKEDAIQFKKATINITGIDSRYIYCGADVGVFVKTTDGWKLIKIKRVLTNSLTLNIDDFGDITKYTTYNIYALGYRVLYRPIGNDVNTLLQNDWTLMNDGYNCFTKKLKVDNIFVNGDNDGTIGDNSADFSRASLTLSDLDATGNYVYFGVDVGVLRKTSTAWELIKIKRIATSSLKIYVQDLGDIIDYQTDSEYAIGYRILYKPTGADINNLVENQWKVLQNGEQTFKRVTSPVIDLSDEITGRNNWFADANLDTEKYNYYFYNSEIVSKFHLNLARFNFDTYEVDIELNHNNENTDTEISNIKYITTRIVRDNTYNRYRNANKVNNQQYFISGTPQITNGHLKFKIKPASGYENKKIEIYFKYKIKKKPSSSTSAANIKPLVNYVTIKGKTDDFEDVVTVQNKIRITGVKVRYQ